MHMQLEDQCCGDEDHYRHSAGISGAFLFLLFLFFTLSGRFRGPTE